MSEAAGATLALLRSVYERWGRGDFNTPEIFHSEVSTVWDSAIPGAGRVAYEGVAALGESLRTFIGEFDRAMLVADEFLEAPDTFVVTGTMLGTGRRSGVPVESPFAHVWWFEDGLAVRLVGFIDRDAALRLAGLT